MGRFGRSVRTAAIVGFGVVLLVVGLGPPAMAAGPGTGTVTAVFTDVCGFVKADFTDADPVAAQIHTRRDGGIEQLNPQFVGGGGTTTIYVAAANGQTISYSWEVTGGTGTDQLDRVHITPGGCDEPNVSVAITADACDYVFTFRVSNSGSAPADIILDAPSIFTTQMTIPAGGSYEATVPAMTGGGFSSLVWVREFKPGGSDINFDTTEWGHLERGCGPTTAPDGSSTSFAFFVPTSCNNVKIDLFPMNVKGLLQIFRNGEVVVERGVEGGDTYEFNIQAVNGDQLSIGLFPPIDYTVVTPPACHPVAAAGPPPAAPPAPVVKPPSPSASPNPSASPSPSPSPSGAAGAGTGTPSSQVVAPPPSGPPGFDPVSLTTPLVGGVIVGGLLAGLGIFLLLARRRRVRAIPYPAARHALSVTDIGPTPTLSLRWVPYADRGVQTLWEGTP